MVTLAYDGLSVTQGGFGPSPFSPDPGLLYRLKLMDPNGRLLGSEHVRADTDENALYMALRRLGRAAIVEVWRCARRVGQVQRPSSLH
jgi:hypothetical protein